MDESLLKERVRQWQGSLARVLKLSSVSNTLWLGSSSVVNGLLGAVSSALLARYLGLGDFGTFTLVLSLMNLMTDLGDLGMTSTFVRFGSESVAKGNMDRFQRVLTIVLRTKILLGIVICAGSVLFLRSVVGFVFTHVDDRIASYFLLSLVAVALGIAASIFYPMFQSFKDFRTPSLLSVVRILCKLVLVVLCLVVFSRISITIAIWIEIATLILFLGLNSYYSPVRTFTTSVDRQLQREIFSFSKWLTLYQIIALIGGRLDIVFVGGLADARALGLYGAASKISALVTSVANSYYAVLVTEASSSASGEVLRQRRRNAFVIVAMISGGIVALGALASPIVRLVFGSQFADASVILQIMCVGLILTVLAYPVNATLFALNKSAVFPIMSAVSVSVFLLSNLALIPRLGAVGAAIAFSLSAGVALLVSLTFYFFIARMKRKTGLVEGG